MYELWIYVAAHVIIVGVTAYVAVKKGDNVIVWSILAFLFSIFALPFLAFAENKNEEAAFQRAQKKRKRRRRRQRQKRRK